MRTCILLLLSLCLSLYKTHAQLPPRQWAHHYGGSQVDIPFSIKLTTDGGTILAGYTDSRNGDVSPQPGRDYWDLWVLKLNNCGEIQWERSFGGTGYESARDIIQTADGSYLVLGETNSTDGGVIAGYGGTKDIWLLQLSATGDLLWQKRYGGNGLDIGNRIITAPGGGYFIAASTSSNDGDIHGNHGTSGYTDGAIIKIAANGNIEWSKCFGGTKNEEFFDLAVIGTTLYLAGYANSVDGDIPPSQKNYDVWVLALDGNANKIFSKVYGGSQNDVAYAMTTGKDGTLTLAGYTTSTDGDVKGAKGGQDYWIINIDKDGRLNWQRVAGGSDADYAKAILTDDDGGYLVGGISYSINGDVRNARGEGDFWTVKLTSAGDTSWTKTWGGNRSDHLRSMAFDPAKKTYYLAGDSESDNGDFVNTLGNTDFALIKLKIADTLTRDSAVCSLETFIPINDTLQDACGFDSLYITWRPVLLGGPFPDSRRADTIFIGQQVTIHAGGNGTIQWEPSPTLSCTDCADPIANPVVTTVYTAINTLEAGCEVRDRFTVVVLNDALVWMPTAFTPNGDGRNDLYGPIGKVPDGYRLQLFNRNGEVVFRSSSMYHKWDGRVNGKQQPGGVFIYTIDYKDLQQKPHQQKGTFMLIR